MSTVVVDLSHTSTLPDRASVTTPSGAPVADALQRIDPAIPVKRGPGRPKGSGKKQRINAEPSSSPTTKVKRPVGRPRKDGLPAGSLLPPKDKRPAGRPRKSAPPKVGGAPISAQPQGLQQSTASASNTAFAQSGNAIPYGASVSPSYTLYSLHR